MAKVSTTDPPSCHEQLQKQNLIHFCTLYLWNCIHISDSSEWKKTYHISFKTSDLLYCQITSSIKQRESHFLFVNKQEEATIVQRGKRERNVLHAFIIVCIYGIIVHKCCQDFQFSSPSYMCLCEYCSALHVHSKINVFLTVKIMNNFLLHFSKHWLKLISSYG